MDLLTLELSLRPLAAPERADALPQWWGRAAHALFLAVIKSYDDTLSAHLHDPEDPLRPFTASSLTGYSSRRGLELNRRYTLRFTALTAELTAHLQRAAESGPLASGQIVELDYQPFRIEQAAAHTQTYAGLSAPYLLAQKPADRRLRLEFLSPVVFKTGGRHVPLPLAELVFGSLLERWNAFAPVVFPVEVKRYALECLAPSRFDLSSRVVYLKHPARRIGSVGQVTYTSTNPDRYWLSVLHTLSAFAAYSGVGAHVTQGMGYCRKVEDGGEGKHPPVWVDAAAIPD